MSHAATSQAADATAVLALRTEVPVGAVSGQEIVVIAPNGARVRARVPQGLSAGQLFHVTFPAAAAGGSTAAWAGSSAAPATKTAHLLRPQPEQAPLQRLQPEQAPLQRLQPEQAPPQPEPVRPRQGQVAARDDPKAQLQAAGVVPTASVLQAYCLMQAEIEIQSQLLAEQQAPQPELQPYPWPYP